MIILAWIVLFALSAAFFNDWLEQQQNPNQTPASQQHNGVIEVVLEPNRQHHYVVTGSINRQPVTFLLDTGATDVVIPQPLARRLGLPQGIMQYATTANGTIPVYATEIEQLSIGDIQLQKVRASINPAMRDNVILLGMSALKKIEFSQRGDTLILRQ